MYFEANTIKIYVTLSTGLFRISRILIIIHSFTYKNVNFMDIYMKILTTASGGSSLL